MKLLSRNFLISAAAIVFTNVIATPAEAGQTCKTATRDRSNLTVYNSPNGDSINELRFGREVTIEKTTRDSQGNSWAKVSGYYEGSLRQWGWVRQRYLSCENYSNRITVYGRPGCSRTTGVMQNLSRQGIAYDFKNIDTSSANQEMWSRIRSSNLSVSNSFLLPVVHINNRKQTVLITSDSSQIISEFRNGR